MSQATPNFKIGDIVKCLDCSRGYTDKLVVGSLYKVIGCSKNMVIIVTSLTDVSKIYCAYSKRFELASPTSPPKEEVKMKNDTPIIEPKLESIPKGYKLSGEFREPKKGEYYIAMADFNPPLFIGPTKRKGIYFLKYLWEGKRYILIPESEFTGLDKYFDFTRFTNDVVGAFIVRSITYWLLEPVAHISTAIVKSTRYLTLIGGVSAVCWGTYHKDETVDFIKSLIPHVSIEAPEILQLDNKEV